MNLEELKKYLVFNKELIKMADQKFEVQGNFKNGYDYQPFKKVVSATNEKQATEKTLMIIGSKHRLKRNYIKIDGTRLIDGE